jgi:1,4-alpha-glucan branching enzyme
VRLRPAYALATLSVFAVFAVVASPPLAPSHDLQAVGDSASAGQVYVQFRLEASGASQVALVGSFTAWQPDYELRETAPGTWSILVPLRPGVYDYAFVVDGREWVADPHAFQIDDGFGGTNSRIALPSPPTGAIQS